MITKEKMCIERFDLGALSAGSMLDMPDPTVEGNSMLASPLTM